MLTLDTRTQFHTLLDALTLANADDTPALIYISSDVDPITVTRLDFLIQTRQYAANLSASGIKSGDLVIIAHTQSLESIFAFWGVMLLGGIPSMFPTLTEKLDPDIYMANMAELVGFSDVRAILTTDDFAVNLREIVPCPVFGATALAKIRSADTVQVRPTPESIAFLQHSSGTTGLQKGVALSHQAVLNQLASYADALALREDDVIVSWLPLYHDMGLIAAFMQPLVQGIPLVLMSPFDWVRRPAMLFQAISDYRGTLCWLPNFAYNHCAQRIRDRDLDGLDASSMRAFVNCSEPVRHDSHQQFLERFASIGVTREMLTVSYAMAENTFAVTQSPIGQAPTHDRVDLHGLQSELRARPIDIGGAIQVSCGAPIVGTSVKVVDAQGHDLPERHVGEIMVKSDCMLTGYYMRPDLQPFDADGWYMTGDRGYLANGEVYIVGRSKDLIINAGKNVFPQDIEAVVNTVEGIHKGRVVVFGVPDDTEGTELIAIVAELASDIDPEDKKAVKTINRAIRQAIAHQTTVTAGFVTLVDSRWLIKTSSGKIARAANREKWLHARQRR